MQFLHPAYTIVTLVLIAFSFMEVYSSEYKNYKSVWVVVGVLILLAGFRSWVGADYGVYVQIYEYYGQQLDYTQIFNKAFFLKNNLELEWLYVFFGDLFYDFRIPFFFFTFFIALLSLIPKYYSFEKVVVYPALSLLLYLYPSYYIADSGQMRQGVAMGLIMLSFIYIRKRNLWMFLLMVYIAIGFHKSSAIFLPAYWLVKIPLNSKKIILIILLCVILSPFQLYEYFSVLESLAPNDIYSGFSDYSTIESTSGGIKFTDLICLMYTFFLVAFDKEATENIPYYEYMRNMGVAGICIYFIFRGSPIFSSRLTAIYLIFMVMTLPNIIAAIQNINLRRYMHFIVIGFVIFYYFVFATMQAERAGFTPGRYHNYLFFLQWVA